MMPISLSCCHAMVFSAMVLDDYLTLFDESVRNRHEIAACLLGAQRVRYRCAGLLGRKLEANRSSIYSFAFA